MQKFTLPFGVTLALVMASSAQSQINMQVGVLSCDVSAGIGLIIEQKQKVNCTFTDANNNVQHYVGALNEYGLELGETKAAEMTWTVLAASSTVAPGALSGTYAGANADASLSVGAGVNVLVGGLDKSFTLQPFSVDTETGTALSAGVETLTLEYQP